MAKYLSLPYSDDTSLLFPHYDYKYCRKCTGYVWILSKSDNVQMFVSILSSLTVLFHKPLGFVCKTLTHLGNTCMVSPQKVDTSYFDNSVPMHKNHMHLSPQLDLAKGNRWANNVQRSSNLYRSLHIFCIKILFIMCQIFWPWKAVVLIVVAWCWSIKILDDWIIILWTSDPFCVTLEVHREAYGKNPQEISCTELYSPIKNLFSWIMVIVVFI